VRVSEVEGELGGESRTLRTVQALQAAHPEHRFSLIIGSDLQVETASWYRAEELRRLVPFVVVGRGGHASASADAITMPEISSSDVRRRLREGLPVDRLVPRGVLDYIRERGLYGTVEAP
jgi:nicotinate-nucleotide adenylyltransferase